MPERIAAPRSLQRLLWRAFRLRCPQCGGRDFFRSWSRVAPACPTCGYSAARLDYGYAAGALAVNTVIAETLALGAAVLAVVATWPDPPWTPILWGGATLAVVLPIACYPLSKSVFIALNWWVRMEDVEPGVRPDH